MPYCPKCDMEFVEGVTVCTDCGGPLVESREAAEAMKEAEEAKREEELRLQMEEFSSFEEGGAGDAETVEGTGAPEKDQEVKEPVKAYVNKEQRFEDMSSSASAFFIVGGILAAAAVLCLTGILPLPMTGIMKYMFQGLLAVMAVGSLLVAVSSRKRAAELKSEAAEEEQETEEILAWFQKSYTGKELDEQIRMEDPDLSGEELSLKRFELIQDLLITGRDIPDPSYADALCDMLYSRLYEKNEA